jgi:SAM-dependent methyltransferase
MSYRLVTDHRGMALDSCRNDAYGRALKQAIGPETVVLDLGAGTGIHGLMAARLGAKRVYLVEPEDIVFVAEEIAKANCLQGVVRCLQGRIEDIDLPEEVDVIVSVLTGNFLLTEDLLESLFYARDQVLKPNGVLIPSAATMDAVPVSAHAVHAKEIGSWSTPQHGINLSSARTYAANTIFYRSEGLKDSHRLAEPQVLHTLNFYTDQYASVRIDTTFEITQSGPCDGWLGWFSMELGDRWLSTSPFERTLHWSPAFLPLDPPMIFEKGERVSFALHRSPFGDWTWEVRGGGVCQQHSTFLAMPLGAASVTKAALGYRPSLSQEAKAVLHVLSHFDGSRCIEELAKSVLDEFPHRYRNLADAQTFIQRVVKRYA